MRTYDNPWFMTSLSINRALQMMACWLNMFESFYEICKNMVLGSKIRFSAQMSNNAKVPWNIQKTPLKHV